MAILNGNLIAVLMVISGKSKVEFWQGRLFYNLVLDKLAKMKPTRYNCAPKPTLKIFKLDSKQGRFLYNFVLDMLQNSRPCNPQPT